MAGSPRYAMPDSGPKRAGRRIGLALVALVALGVVAVFALRSPEAPARSEAAFLQERAAVLREQTELAKSDARYLLLDPDQGAITLYQGPVPLRSWPVIAVEAGARRLGEEEAGWRSRRWSAARIEPPVERDRRVIVSDSVASSDLDLTGAVDWIPPTPEEAVPTPPSFVVHYEGGLGLEVDAIEAAPAAADSVADSLSFAPPLLDRLAHRVRRFLPRNWDRYRIRVTMPDKEAGSLYRSLPDSTSFLAIIPPH